MRSGRSRRPAVVDKCEATLIEHACHWELAGLRLLGERILAHVAPEIADDALRRKLDHDDAMAQLEEALP